MREDVRVCINPLAARDKFIYRQPRDTDRAPDSDDHDAASAGPEDSAQRGATSARRDEAADSVATAASAGREEAAQGAATGGGAAANTNGAPTDRAGHAGDGNAPSFPTRAPVDPDPATSSAAPTMDEVAYCNRPTAMEDTAFGEFLRFWRVASSEKGTSERIACGRVHYMKRGREGILIPWPSIRTDASNARCAYAMLKLYMPHRSEEELIGGDGAVATLKDFMPQLPRNVQAALNADPDDDESGADNANGGGGEATDGEDDAAGNSDDDAWAADQQSTRDPAAAPSTATVSSDGVRILTRAERQQWEGFIDHEAGVARAIKKEQREQFTASNAAVDASDYARVSAFTGEQTARRDSELEHLNAKQREVRDKLYNAFTRDGDNEQVMLTVAGEAGTGKSRIIEMVVLDALLQFGGAGLYGPVLVVAMTNAAAHLVGGQTVFKTLTMHKLNGSESALNKLRTELRQRFHPIKAIVLDEKSLLSTQNFGQILALWKFAFPEIEAPFAGRHFVLMGDFHQLPPVTGTPLFQEPKSTDSPATHHAWKALNERFEFVYIFAQRARRKLPLQR